MEKKNTISEMLTNITKQVTDVNHHIKDIIEGDGLENKQIESWINSLNQIIRLVDHSTEVLEESKHRQA
jgi:hypothetical protein